MRLTEYLKSLIKADTGDSSKSFSVVVSVLLGAFLGMVLAFCLVWDVCTNGYVKTGSETIWWTLAGIAVLITGGSVAKVMSEMKNSPSQTLPRREGLKPDGKA